MAAVAAIAKIGAKIASKSAGVAKGVAKSVKRNAKIKKRIRVAKKRFLRKRRQDKLRRDKEALLEQQQTQKNTEGKKSKGGGKSILERLISLVQALIVGFVLNKLPKIIDFIKKVVKIIRDVVDKIKNFFDGVVGFFKGVGKVISNAFNAITNLSFDKLKENITGQFDKLKNAFSEIKDKLLGGVKSFLGLKKKKPRKEIKRELSDKDLKDKELKSSVDDIQKTMSSKSNEFNDTIKTIEKAGTGVDIVGPENSNLTEQVASKISVDNDGKPTSLDIPSSGGSSGQTSTSDNVTPSGGTSDFTISQSSTNTGSLLNISDVNRKASGTSITPSRKTKTKVVLVGNKGSQFQMSQNKSSQSLTLTESNDNTLKDHFTLSLF
tara:strand:+ start:327 stop:1463 length:1137 start_codon:yes stop_codon:yes gene_type:complete